MQNLKHNHNQGTCKGQAINKPHKPDKIQNANPGSKIRTRMRISVTKIQRLANQEQ